jgi:hypothetical protein
MTVEPLRRPEYPVEVPRGELRPGDVFKDSDFRHKHVVVSGEPLGRDKDVIPILRHGETWVFTETVTVIGFASSLHELGDLLQKLIGRDYG